MSEADSKTSASKVHEKGPLYRKIAGGVSDTSEGGLEKIIFDDMVDRGWRAGNPKDYDREYCVGLVKLRDFLNTIQPKIAEELLLDTDNPTRRKFLAIRSGMERWGRQSTEPERAEDGLSVEEDPNARKHDEYHRELRADRRR
jgi:hypothetical protein